MVCKHTLAASVASSSRFVWVVRVDVETAWNPILSRVCLSMASHRTIFEIISLDPTGDREGVRESQVCQPWLGAGCQKKS